MTEATRALYEFYSGFGLPVYVEGYIPDNAELPYITFDSVDSGLTRQAAHHVQVWYPGMDNSLPAATADRITTAIGDGTRLITEHGLVVLYPDTPLIQVRAIDSDADRHICYAYISLATMTYIMEERQAGTQQQEEPAVEPETEEPAESYSIVPQERITENTNPAANGWYEATEATELEPSVMIPTQDTHPIPGKNYYEVI